MRLILAIIILCAVARADTKITWLADVTADRAETVTGAQSNQIHDAAAHIVRADNPHGVTAAQIGALTAEQDLAALRTYHYGSPDIVESPAEWFVFDGAGTVTAFNWAAGRTNVVIPWAIGGVPVTAIGANAFENSGIISLIAPQTITSIGDFALYSCYVLASFSLPQAQTVGVGAFQFCNALASVSLPQAQTLGENAFANCTSLTSVSLPNAQTVGAYVFNSCGVLASVSLPQAQTVGVSAFISCLSLTSVYFDNDAPTIGAGIFAGITPNQVTNYVTNPQATGWGATLADMPVVRLPLYADAIYQAGVCLVPMSDFTATNAMFNTWFAGLFSETNKWMAAYGWGNWAGPVASNAAAIAVLQTNTLTRQEVDALQSAVDAKADKSTTLTINGIVGNLSSNNVWCSALPTNGCTEIYGVTPEITGKTYAYYLYATNNYTLSIAADAPRCHYSLEIIGTNVCTLSAGMQLRGEWKATGTNAVVIVPSTGTLWNVYGRGM